MNDFFLKALKYRFLAFYLLVLGLVLVRIATHHSVLLPTNKYLVFEATIEEPVKFSQWSQRIKFKNLEVSAPLYPRYAVGERVRVEGFADSGGKIANPKISVIGWSGGFLTVISKIRQDVAAKVESLLPQREAALVLGAVMGVDNIPREFKDELIRTGTIHVVVVSGQNLAIVAGIFLALARYLSRRVSLVAAISAVFLYAVVSGFNPPVVRALIMVVAGSVSLFLGRATISLGIIFLAAALILLVWPQDLSSISFLLTFAATVGISTLGKRLEGVFRHLPLLGEDAAISLAAFIFTAPVILYFFGRVSLLAPLVNVLVVGAVFPIMVLGFLLCGTAYIFMPAAKLLAFLVYIPAHYFSQVVYFASQVNIGTISAFHGNIYFSLGLYTLLFALLFVWRNPRNH